MDKKKRNSIPFTKNGVRQMSATYLQDVVRSTKNPKVREKARNELLRRKLRVPVYKTEPLLKSNNENVGKKTVVKKDPLEKLHEQNLQHFKSI